MALAAMLAVTSCGGSGAPQGGGTTGPTSSGQTTATTSPPSASTPLTAATTVVERATSSAPTKVSATTVASTPAVTEQLLYQPFTPSGLKSDVVVSGELTGTCFGGSIAATYRPDAWRCMAGNQILDPCFENPYPTAPLSVLCTESPGKPVTRLLLTTGVPEDMRNATVEGTSLPWALELTTGIRCGTFTGTQPPPVGGQPVLWGCEDGSTLIGGFNADAPLWTIQQDNQSSSGAIVAVAKLWK